MPSLADKLGWGPVRNEEQVGPGRYRVTVKPPLQFIGEALDLGPGGTVDMNEHQYQAYKRWLRGEGELWQIVGLSASQRELLMSGINSQTWDEKFKGEDD